MIADNNISESLKIDWRNPCIEYLLEIYVTCRHVDLAWAPEAALKSDSSFGGRGPTAPADQRPRKWLGEMAICTRHDPSTTKYPYEEKSTRTKTRRTAT